MPTLGAQLVHRKEIVLEATAAGAWTITVSIAPQVHAAFGHTHCEHEYGHVSHKYTHTLSHPHTRVLISRLFPLRVVLALTITLILSRLCPLCGVLVRGSVVRRSNWTRVWVSIQIECAGSRFVLRRPCWVCRAVQPWSCPQHSNSWGRGG